MKVRNAIEPDNINWQNLGYKKPYRKCMIAVNWVVAVVVLLVSMLLIVLFKVTADNLKKGGGTTISCEELVTKEQAFLNFEISRNQTDESLSCFCQQYSKDHGLKGTLDLDFSEQSNSDSNEP